MGDEPKCSNWGGGNTSHYIRSILEQSCVVRHSSLTEENVLDLERVQKAVIRLILGEKYENDEDGLLRAIILETRLSCFNVKTNCFM